MPTQQQQLSFAIRAVNEAERALKDIQRDLENTDGAADGLADAFQEVDRATKNLDGESLNGLNAGLLNAAAAGDVTERALIGVADVVGFMSNQIGLNLGPMEEWTRGFADLGGAAGALFPLMQDLPAKIAGIIPKVIAATTAAWAHVAALTAQAVAFAAANAPIIAAAAALAIVAAGVVLLVKHWDTIVEKVPILGTVVDAVREAFQTFTGYITDTVMATLETLSGYVTDTLSPVLDGLSSFVTDTVQPAFQGLWELFNDKLLPIIGDLLDLYLAPLKLAFEAAKTAVTDVLIPGLQSLWGYVSNTLLPLLGTAINLYLTPLKVAFELAKAAVTDVLVPGLQTLASFITDTVLPKVDDVITKLEGPFDTAVGIGTTAVGLFKDGFLGVRDAIQWVIDKLQAVADKITSLPEPPGWVMKGISGAGNIIESGAGILGIGAAGGVVTRPTLALIGEAGPEAVLPLNRMPGAMPLELAGMRYGPGQTVVNHFHQEIHVGGSVVTLRELAYELKRLGPVV